MEKKNIFTIRSVAQSTGLKPYIIRTWERRYQAVEPQRTPTNRRVYAEGDIEKLALLKRAVELGHSISQIARMSTEELTELLEAVPVSASSSAGRDMPVADSASPNHYRRKALQASIDLDPLKLEQAMSGAAVQLSRTDFIHQVVVPLLTTIGERWATGQVRITCEHLTSVVVRSFLWDMLRSVELSENAPKIVMTTPVGQWHELGLLVAALEAAECGWRPVYLGPNLPAEEIAYSVERTDAKALVIYIAHSLDDGRLATELENLHRYLDENFPLFVGGSGSDPLKNVLNKIKAHHLRDAQHFRRKLRQLEANH